jgi:hypothetical protein
MAVVGVPEIKPVVLLIVKPAGRSGDTVMLSKVPVTVAVSGVIAVPVTPLMLCPLYAIAGAAMVIAIVTAADALPALLVAVIVYTVDALAAVGFPDILPVAVSNVKPAGRGGKIDQDETVPVTEGESISIAVPTVPAIEADL